MKLQGEIQMAHLARICTTALLSWTFAGIFTAFSLSSSAAEPPIHSGKVEVSLKNYNGRPAAFVNGKPVPLPTYSPVGWSTPHFNKQVPWFAPHKMGAYFLIRPSAGGEGWGASQFWQGDNISDKPLMEVTKGAPSFEEQIALFDKLDPGAWFFVREIQNEPPNSWKKLHPDQLFVDEDGRATEIPSLASDLYWDSLAKVAEAQISYIERQPWSNRVIGYWCGMFGEGTFAALANCQLYDHGPAMQAKWRSFLKEKYSTAEALQSAYRDKTLTFETAAVPKDPLLGPQRQMAALTYWQSAADNQPRRDYLELNAKLVHDGYRKIMGACATATGGGKLCLYDAFKMPMQGWSLSGFFDRNASWWPAYPDLLSGGGYLGVARLFSTPGFDGLVTPHDYQARGMGGVYEPEGIADSMVLRGKFFLCEMDLRTYSNDTDKGGFGCARDVKEYAAISWRNFATSFTRGFHSYWMDLCGKNDGWFGSAEIQQVIARQVEVLRESIEWPHEDVPGVAMIIDDTSVLETNGSGNFLNEAVMWETKMGLARCGVPYRIYLLDDLRLPNFPKHKVFYFPNLFKVDDTRISLLKEKVFRDGNVVLWGPGSGISDGTKLSADSAARLTGFQFEPLIPSNVQRRTLITNFTHPITAGLNADTVIGGPLAYGPALYPKDGTALGAAWTKLGFNYTGLAVKEFGNGAGKGRGEGDWASVFTTAVPVPAAIWRNLARYSGEHVYCETGDILMADSSIVALHSVRSGEKRIELPSNCRIHDVVSGTLVSDNASSIAFKMEEPGTRIFRLENAQIRR